MPAALLSRWWCSGRLEATAERAVTAPVRGGGSRDVSWVTTGVRSQRVHPLGPRRLRWLGGPSSLRPLGRPARARPPGRAQLAGSAQGAGEKDDEQPHPAPPCGLDPLEVISATTERNSSKTERNSWNVTAAWRYVACTPSSGAELSFGKCGSSSGLDRQSGGDQ